MLIAGYYAERAFVRMIIRSEGADDVIAETRYVPDENWLSHIRRAGRLER